MKLAFLFLCAGLSAAAVQPVSGQAVREEFNSLRVKRDAAADRAVAPVRSRFVTDAEALVEKAIQQGDLKLAEAIKREILAVQSAKSRQEIRQILVETTWNTGSGTPGWKFAAGGTFAIEGGLTADYAIENNGTVTLLWTNGKKSVLTPNKDFSEMRESGAGTKVVRKVAPAK